jgi:hypothetical protein
MDEAVLERRGLSLEQLITDLISDEEHCEALAALFLTCAPVTKASVSNPPSQNHPFNIFSIARKTAADSLSLQTPVDL